MTDEDIIPIYLTKDQAELVFHALQHSIGTLKADDADGDPDLAVTINKGIGDMEHVVDQLIGGYPGDIDPTYTLGDGE